MNQGISVVILAAGRGRRLGADKALIDLEGETAIARLVAIYGIAGLSRIYVVRARDAEPLPAELDLRVIHTDPGEMIDSLRSALGELGRSCAAILLSPVDYPLVSPATISALTATQRRTDPDVLLPLYRDRPGHPILISQRLFAEILAPEVVSLREVIRRDPERVRSLVVQDPWIHRDIDKPDDLEAARAHLRRG